MDYNGTRFYNIPHYDRYYISKSGILLNKKTLERIPSEKFTKSSGYFVRITNNEGIRTEISILKLLAITFYGQTDLDIKTKINIDKDILDWITSKDIWYDNAEIDYMCSLNKDSFTLRGFEYRKLNFNNETGYYINTDGAIYYYPKHKFLKHSYGTECEYACVNLPSTNTTMHVHRLLGYTFLPGFKPELVVNHKDAHKYNSYVSNLEMVTTQENIIHASKLGLIPGRAFNDAEIESICKLIEKGKSYDHMMKHLPFLEDYNIASLKRLVYRLVNTDQWNDITRKYDLSAYKNCGTDYDTIYSKDDIKKVCELLSTTDLSNNEISNKTGIPRSTIQAIRSGNQWTNVSSLYDINYQKTKENTSKEIIKLIYDMAKTNKYSSVKEIANVLGLDYEKVRRILYYDKFNDEYEFNYKDSKLIEDKNRLSENEVRTVCKMIVEGYSDTEISRTVNRSNQSINAIRQGKACAAISKEYDIPNEKYFKSPNKRLLNPELKKIILTELKNHADLSNPEIRNIIVDKYPELKDDIEVFRIRNARKEL